MRKRATCPGRSFLLGALVILGAAIATAQPPSAPIEPPWPMVVTRTAFAAGSSVAYSCVLDLLDREDEARAEPGTTTLYLDVLATHLAFVGEHRRALEVGDEAFGQVFESQASMPKDSVSPTTLSPVDALPAIVEAAAERSFVLLNEEHRSSVQRAFAHRLLAPLWKEGFRYLALETLSEDPEDLAARGYPVLSSGTYTRDPVYGDLVRRALEMGYKLIPYEAGAEDRRPRPDDTSPLDAVNRRERGQARNLFEQTMKRDPMAKVLVFAGRDHISEGTADGWIPMGAVLAELSGVDPLSINQMVMTEHSERSLEHWAFGQVDKAGWLDRDPILIAGPDGGFWTHAPGSLDASLFHPRTRMVEGRPQWMSMGGIRQPVPVVLPKITEPALLQARVVGESEEAVPLDQVLVVPGQDVPVLMLRPGRYEVRLLSRRGAELMQAEMVIGDAPATKEAS